MKYEVVWGPRAEGMLANIWVAAADRNAVSKAADWLDVHLARHPLTMGESRDSSVHRTAYRGSIGVEFEVIEDD